MKFQAIKGTRDILPPESALWNRVEQTAREVFATYGFGEIRLPIFEQTELFSRSIGGDTDVVSKEMYTFFDRFPRELQELWHDLVEPPPFGDDRDVAYLTEKLDQFLITIEKSWEEGTLTRSRALDEKVSYLKSELNGARQVLHSLKNPRTSEKWLLFRGHISRVVPEIQFEGETISLRPEATASVCRAYIEHGLHTRPGNQKLYYIGPMFRRERPQKGRYRQFYQIGAEVLSPAPRSEGAGKTEGAGKSPDVSLCDTSGSVSGAPARGDAATSAAAEKDLLATAAVDAEVIEMLMTFFARVGLGSTAGVSPASGNAAFQAVPSEKNRQDAGGTSGVTLYINSIGNKDSRRPARNPPDHMHRSSMMIALQNQYAGPFRILRILLNHLSRISPREDF